MVSTMEPRSAAVPAHATIAVLEHDEVAAHSVVRALAGALPHARVVPVVSRRELREVLDAERVDAVVSADAVPGCEWLDAFYLARESDARMPFVFLSDPHDARRDLPGLAALGVHALVAPDDLQQLAPAVQRALDRRAADADPDAASRGPEVYDCLVRAVQDLSGARDLDTVTAIVRTAARRLCGADGASFVLRENDHCYYADEEAIGPLWKGRSFPMATCISGWAMTHRQPAVVPDIEQDPRIPLAAYRPTFVRSLAMVPIRSRDPLGAIGVYWARPRTPAPADVRVLQALADTTAVAMQNLRMFADLENRVRERTHELETFMYAVSHDLRAPIRHIEGFASIALRNTRTPLDDENRRHVDRVVTAAKHLNDMVTGLLDVSRVAAANLVRTPVDLAALAREVADECARGVGHSVEFTAPHSLVVSCDPDLVRLLLVGLIRNSSTFTAEVPHARVEFGRDHEARFFVRDNGVDFDPVDLSHPERLFGVFQRQHPRADADGHGVGLAVAKRVVDKHGGRLSAALTPGGGATFWFTLDP